MCSFLHPILYFHMLIWVNLRFKQGFFFASFTGTLPEVDKTCLVMKRADLASAHLSFLALENSQLSDISTPKYLWKVLNWIIFSLSRKCFCKLRSVCPFEKITHLVFFSRIPVHPTPQCKYSNYQYNSVDPPFAVAI